MIADINTGDLGETSSFDFDTFIRAGVKPSSQAGQRGH